MKILLAVDDSPCSDAAVDAVLAQFPPDGSLVRVVLRRPTRRRRTHEDVCRA